MAKKYIIFLLIAVGSLNTAHVSAKAREKSCCGNQSTPRSKKQGSPSQRYQQKETNEKKESFKERAKNWAKKTWGSVQNIFNKAKSSIEKNLERPESKTRKRWKSTHSQHKAALRSQKLSHKSEESIISHHIDAQDLLEEVEDSDDLQFKKLANRYHRKASQARREAESGQKDLEFALRNAAKESESLKQMNEDNLESIEFHRNALIEYQKQIMKSKRGTN